MPKDISRLFPFSSAPGCFREVHRGQRQTLATYHVLSHSGEKIQLLKGVLHCGAMKTLTPREGMGFPRSLRESGGHLPPSSNSSHPSPRAII